MIIAKQVPPEYQESPLFLGDCFPEDIAVYCHGWSDEQIKKEIAEAAGVDAAEVTLHKFSGWSQTAIYTEV